LLLPKNNQEREKVLDEQVQERLKILQDNNSLGSGIRIAQYDLEIRGAGNFLGTEQSGHVESLGYEMYMDLLQETIAQLKGEELSKVEPEVNLKIPAFIPEKYISDVRLRLSFYKILSEIRKPEDLDEIEQELRERFGALPEEVVNLCGVMLIRLLCKKLGVQDLSVGPKSLSLVFADSTPIKPEAVLKLTQKSHRKYVLVSPGNRLNIRMEKMLEKSGADDTSALGWSLIHQELSELASQLL
jgi:transcription-repair coupling factor (superfamily II helicase)